MFELPAHIIPLTSRIFNTDAFEFAKSQPSGFCNHILTEPDQSSNLDIDKLISFFPVAFNALPEYGYFAFWFPIEVIAKLKSALKSSGFEFQPWPLLGCRMDYPRKHDCNPAQFYAPSYHTCMLAFKPGSKLVKRQGQSFYSYSEKLTRERYGTTWCKPVAIYRWILSGISRKNDIIWDPFAGGGIVPIATIISALQPIATEIDPIQFKLMEDNIKIHYEKELGPNILFT